MITKYHLALCLNCGDHFFIYILEQFSDKLNCKSFFQFLLKAA